VSLAKKNGRIRQGERLIQVVARLAQLKNLFKELEDAGYSIEQQAAILELDHIFGIKGSNEHFLRSDYYLMANRLANEPFGQLVSEAQQEEDALPE
jgi:hypothetical protein